MPGGAGSIRQNLPPACGPAGRDPWESAWMIGGLAGGLECPACPRLEDGEQGADPDVFVELLLFGRGACPPGPAARGPSGAVMVAPNRNSRILRADARGSFFVELGELFEDRRPRRSGLRRAGSGRHVSAIRRDYWIKDYGHRSTVPGRGPAGSTGSSHRTSPSRTYSPRNLRPIGTPEAAGRSA